MEPVKLACFCAVAALATASYLAHAPMGDPPAAQQATARVGLGNAATPPQLSAARPNAPSYGSETILPDRYGQFHTAVEIGGQRLTVMVDTGASFVALTFEDADRLGLRPAPSDFIYKVGTANGAAAVARTELPEIRLGAISVRNVKAFVSTRGALSQSLLGMSFLSRLGGFGIDGGRLVLRQ